MTLHINFIKHLELELADSVAFTVFAVQPIEVLHSVCCWEVKVQYYYMGTYAHCAA